MLENTFELDLSELPEENMTFHDCIVNVNGNQPPILMMIQDHSTEMIGHALRLYKLKAVNNKLVIEYEIEAFAFPSHEAAVSFANRLVDMKAIDILTFIAENSQPSPPHMLQ